MSWSKGGVLAGARTPPRNAKCCNFKWVDMAQNAEPLVQDVQHASRSLYPHSVATRSRNIKSWRKHVLYRPKSKGVLQIWKALWVVSAASRHHILWLLQSLFRVPALLADMESVSEKLPRFGPKGLGHSEAQPDIKHFKRLHEIYLYSVG